MREPVYVARVVPRRRWFAVTLLEVVALAVRWLAIAFIVAFWIAVAMIVGR